MPLLALLQTGCLIVLAALLVVAAWQDLRTLHISNSLPLSIVAAFVAWSILGLVAETVTVEGIALSVGCAAVLFLVAAAGFAAGMIGGGDVKLAAAVALFAGPALVLDFLLVVGIVGGVLGIIVLAGVPLGPVTNTGGTTVRGRLRGRLPYGPAIAAGGLWVTATLACALK
jgi:prepilin peptidase CpaA